MLQEFDVELRDRKGSENPVADHLSRIESPGNEQEEINDTMPGESLMKITHEEPWYADLVNYLVANVIPGEYSYQQKKKLMHDIRQYYWDEPYLYKQCADGIVRRCLPKEEVRAVIYHCHLAPYGGHASTAKTQAKILQAGFYWPSMFNDVFEYVKSGDACHRTGKMSR